MTIEAVTDAHTEALVEFAAGLPEVDRTFIRKTSATPTKCRLISASLAVGHGRRRRTHRGYVAVRSWPGWSDHVSDIRLVVGKGQPPRWRRQRRSRHAVMQTIADGRRKVVVELPADQGMPWRCSASWAFTGEALLRDHIRDRHGDLRDLLVLAHFVDDNWSGMGGRSASPRRWGRSDGGTPVSEPTARSRSMARGADRVRRGRAGSRRSCCTPPELWRSSIDAWATAAWAPILATAPRGDRHRCWSCPDSRRTTGGRRGLRASVRSLGYHAHGWRLGRNIGPTDHILNGLTTRGPPRRPLRRAGVTARLEPGWHLRAAVTWQSPDKVRQVITLGSPIRLQRPRPELGQPAL